MASKANRVFEAMTEQCVECGHHVSTHREHLVKSMDGDWACAYGDCRCLRTTVYDTVALVSRWKS